jgi:sec-independent protein translocase protein TatA
MFEGLSPSHLIIVLGVALLLFGDRLPQVMRSVGRGVMEFKKGLRGIESAIEAAATAPMPSQNRSSIAQDNTARRDEIVAPRFDPPTSEPRAEKNLTESAEDLSPAPHTVAQSTAIAATGEHHEQATGQQVLPPD